MFCNHCGMQVPAGTRICPNCKRQLSVPPAKKFCHHCGMQVADGARICPNCKSQLAVSVAKKYCAHCGREIDAKAVICVHCGVPVQSLNENKKNPCAAIGLATAFFVPLAGWILGGIGLSKATNEGRDGKGVATAAIIVATIMFVINFIAIMSML